MPITITIKQVPERIAERLRRRAASNRRSLQGELLLIIERAASGDFAVAGGSAAPRAASRSVHDDSKTARLVARKSTAGSRADGRLNLEQLWQRAHRLGAPMPGESAALIRRDRDARHSR